MEQKVGFRSVAIDVTSDSWALSSTEMKTQRPCAIWCNATTTITAALCGDGTETAWIIPAGLWYLSFKSINTSSTTKSGYKILFPS